MKFKITVALLFIAAVSAGYVAYKNNYINKIINEGKAIYNDVKGDKQEKKKENGKKKEKSVLARRYVFPSEEPVRAVPGKHKFLVKVKISEQKVRVYKDGKRIRTMECSTGMSGDDNDTPIGHFKINGYYGESFYNSKYKEGARYWVGFINGQYLFHSIPTEEDGEAIASEARKLGNRASHGCVRLSIKDAFWFYEVIPQGADVIIEK